MAMRQALSMSPKQREDLAKLGEQLFSSRKRRFTDTPTEEDLKNDKNIEFVDEPKKTEEAIPVIELGSSYKKDQSSKKSKDEEASNDKSDRFDEDDFTILPEEENFFEKMRNMMSGNIKKKIEIVKETGVRFKDVAGSTSSRTRRNTSTSELAFPRALCSPVLRVPAKRCSRKRRQAKRAFRFCT